MTALANIVRATSRAADRVFPPADGITILIYHRVGGGSDSAVDLEPDMFDDQLTRLARDFRVISLGQAVDELAAKTDEPEPGVVITFDDGTDDFTDVSVPLLVRHGLPATLYVATEFVDSGTSFPWGAKPTSWAALRDAHATGLIDIGSHTHTHRLLDRLDAASVADDLQRSMDLIAEHIGAPALHFGYPKAMPGSPAAEIEVRKRFRSASLASNRVNRPGLTDCHRLGRTPIQRTDRTEQFLAKAGGGMRLEGQLRSTISRLRYRRATQ